MRKKRRAGRETDVPKRRQNLGKSGRWLFLLLLLRQKWLHVNAAEKGPQRRTEMMERCRQPKGEDRTEMKKVAKLLRCTFAQWISGVQRGNT